MNDYQSYVSCKKVELYSFNDDGVIPNNKLPVIVYRNIIGGSEKSVLFQKIFASNNWLNNWRDTILAYDHFHSNTHEVLGVGLGDVTLRIGGKNGQNLSFSAGDVVILPAGVGHYFITSENEYEIVGGYPDGAEWDLHKSAFQSSNLRENIASLSKPKTDPIFGNEGALIENWI